MALSDNRWFGVVKRHIDSMLEFGRGPESPLFGGVIDAGLRKVVTFLNIPPAGIRISDYNWCGNNLMHEIPLLETMLALTKLTGDARYESAVNDMFTFYAAHCPHPDSGLFPWGEHAQWSFTDRQTLGCTFLNGMQSYKTGSIIHDHLRHAPPWFWERMWNADPQVVVNFARGLNRHIVDVKTFEHNRHGVITGPWWRDPEKPNFDQGKDFARHSGFFIADTLFAYKRSGDRSLYEWARRKLEWHLNNRLPTGIVRGPVRSKKYDSEGQHDSLALSVAEAADLLGRDTADGKYFADWADELFDARRRQYRGQGPELPDRPGDPKLWLAGYSRKPLLPEGTLDQGNLLRLIHERTGIAWYADQLAALGQWCVQHLPEPPAAALIPRPFHQHLEMLLTAYQHNSQPALLDAADRVAGWAIDRFWTGELMLGQSGIKYYGKGTNYEFVCDPWATDSPTPGMYHSISGTPLLIRSLLQLALVQEGQPDLLGPDLHRR